MWTPCHALRSKTDRGNKEMKTNYVPEGCSMNIDWELFRVEAAKDFMSAIIVREAPQYQFACRNVANRATEAIMWADELIKQLREKK